MTRDTISTRRRFLKQGALLAGPIAAVAVPTAAIAGDGRAARLQQLEDEAAIRALHRDWLRHANADAAQLGADIRGIIPDHGEEPHPIVIASHGTRASWRHACLVELETELPQDCTLAQMKHAQGEGCVRHSERRLLTTEYEKRDGAWAIARVELSRV